MVLDGFPFLLKEFFPLLMKGILFYIYSQGGGQKKDMEGCKITSNIHTFKIKNNKSLIKLTSK